MFHSHHQCRLQAVQAHTIMVEDRATRIDVLSLKVSHDIFGIVDHSNDSSVMYLFDEHIGPKNTDHTLSFLTHYWNQLHQKHPWIHRLAIFLDNATSTNKNEYLFSWAMVKVVALLSQRVFRSRIVKTSLL